MNTYLLEKSRLVAQVQPPLPSRSPFCASTPFHARQADSERNYHIFYQLCAAACAADSGDDGEAAAAAATVLPGAAQALGPATELFFANRGGAGSEVVGGVDDAADFTATCEAMGTVGIAAEQQRAVFGVLAGLLHLGDVAVVQKSRRSEDARIDAEEDPHLVLGCQLLGLESSVLAAALTTRRITTGRETFNKPLTVVEAVGACHALCKHVYAHIFDSVVARVNDCFAPATAARGAPERVIGVLDIYGFETFELNSFEQFCINYANEKLQQLFNQHVFKLEQDEYVREEIAWSFIDYYDNQPCIDLIEDRLGVMGLLDEQCVVPNGTDDKLILKMYAELAKYPHFAKPRLSNTAFEVRHYAGPVEYEVEGFLEKNKDTLFDEHTELLASSAEPIIAQAFATAAPSASTARRGTGSSTSLNGRATVGAQFSRSLGSLMDALAKTEPHYVRCIKPNDAKVRFELDRPRCIEQLRACGVLETIRISAAGYPSRWVYKGFLSRYAMLARPDEFDNSSVVAGCVSILAPLLDDGKFQFGKTKIFFRAGQGAYLEKLRNDRRTAAAILLQKHRRGFVAARAYAMMRSAALVLQAFARGMAARRLAQRLREAAAATRLQAAWRSHAGRRLYQRQRAAALVLQALVRGAAGRRHYRQVLQEARAVQLQTAWRAARARRNYRSVRTAAIALQCSWRSALARRELRTLRVEARSVDGVRAKLRVLETRNAELMEERTIHVSELTELRSELELVRRERDAALAALASRNAAPGSPAPGVNNQPSSNALAAAEAAAASKTEQVSINRAQLQDAANEAVDGDVASPSEVSHHPGAERLAASTAAGPEHAAVGAEPLRPSGGMFAKLKAAKLAPLTDTGVGDASGSAAPGEMFAKLTAATVAGVGVVVGDATGEEGLRVALERLSGRQDTSDCPARSCAFHSGAKQ